MKDMNITEKAIEDLLLEYADHKAQVKLYMKEESDVDELENNPEFMIHYGFCKCAERWIRCLGMSPNSPVIEQMVKDCV